MFEKCCFCLKHKSAAILMAYLCLVVGIIGTLYCSIRLHQSTERSEWNEIGSFLTLTLFHILLSGLLSSAIIWEKPLIIWMYLGLHISILISLMTFVIIYFNFSAIFWMFFAFNCFIVYWLHCIYIFQKHLRLKIKSGIEYIDNDVYSVCNSMYTNKMFV